MDKKEEVMEKDYYQMDEYEGGTSQTLSFKPETYKRIQSETEELTIKKIFKTNYFERNKQIRYIAQKHENIIDINTINGRAKINLITDDLIKRELSKLSNKEASKLKNIYFGAIEFTIKAYFQKNIDTPIQIYILDDRILGNIQDALIAVVKGNLIYQKLKFIIQPDFSISLKDENKERALTLYYKLDGINMPKGSKVISIETKMVYAITGNHHVKKQTELCTIVPKLYEDILERIEHKEESRITIPEEISIDFNNRQIIQTPRIKPILEGSRLSFKKDKNLIRNMSLSRQINLIKIPCYESDKLRIKTILFNGIFAKEIITEINTGTTTSVIHITEVDINKCEEIEPQIINEPNNSRESIVTKAIKLRIKIQDLEYNLTLGVIEYDVSYQLLLGMDFLNKIQYNITNEGIEINDQNKLRFIERI